MYVNRKSNKVYNVFKLKWNEPIEPALEGLLLADGYMASDDGVSMLHRLGTNYYSGDYIVYDDSGIKEIITKGRLQEDYMLFEDYNRASVDKVTRFLRQSYYADKTRSIVSGEGIVANLEEKGK